MEEGKKKMIKLGGYLAYLYWHEMTKDENIGSYKNIDCWILWIYWELSMEILAKNIDEGKTPKSDRRNNNKPT